MDAAKLEDLINQGRDSAEARLAAGQARLKGGDLELAIDHLNKALEFNPGYTMAWQSLGRALSDSGDREAARAAWQQGIEAARRNGDKQAEKVMRVWLKRLER